MTDVEYFKKFLSDAERILVIWRFDEAQAEPFHSQFWSKEFLARLEHLITQQGQSSRPQGAVADRGVRNNNVDRHPPNM